MTSMVRRAVVALSAAVLVSGGVEAATAQPLRTGVFPSGTASQSDLQRIKSSGASLVRIAVSWRDVAPTVRNTEFLATDPNDPLYDWDSVDAAVTDAVRNGLVPYLAVFTAPDWAQREHPTTDPLAPYRPDAAAFADFMTAIATRYDGAHGEPRVRYWEIWNEPNLSLFLRPQLVKRAPQSPAIYRALVNAAAVAVKAVRKNNFVIAGSVAPFRDPTPSVVAQNQDWGPLAFTRDVLCLSVALTKTCNTKIRFDAWSIHPYTSGGPNHHAQLPNDLSLGDLPKLRSILRAAWTHKTIVAPRFPETWVTEFSWDSNPPDPGGVPIPLLDHWVPEGLYKMWSNGVSVVTWFTVSDLPRSSDFQSGLYDKSGRPKRYLAAFRFPLVALPRGKGVYVWGRVPPTAKGSVIVEQRISAGWRRLGVVRTNGDGIFARTFATSAKGYVRARATRTAVASLPYSIAEPPDRFYNPFGGSKVTAPPPPPTKKK